MMSTIGSVLLFGEVGFIIYMAETKDFVEETKVLSRQNCEYQALNGRPLIQRLSIVAQKSANVS